jgi:uncharacterized membrane protein YqgA involved in biofilm formation
MPFLGTIINFITVMAAGILGTLFKKGISERFESAIMTAMGACVVMIGVDGFMEAAPAVSEDSILSAGLVKVLIVIISMGLGTLLGTLVDIDKWVTRLGNFLEKKMGKLNTGGGFSRGFVSCTILFCVGAMAVNGSIADAVGKPDILIAKSVIDGFSCFMMATSFGIGCAFSAFGVLIYQGILTLGGLFLFTAVPATTLSYVSITGSLVIMLIGTNLLGVTKVKTANMIPAIFLPFALAPLAALLF